MRIRFKVAIGVGAVMVALAGTLALSGGVAAVSNLQFQNRILSLRDASSVRVDVEMDDGDLRLGGGSTSLMNGDFSFNVSDWRPNVRYIVNDGEGTLRLRQGERASFVTPWDMDEVENSWDVRLNGETPMDLKVELGSGTGSLHLGDLDLTGFTVETGAGPTTIDFGQAGGRDVNGRIEGGAGPTTVKLPQNIGVQVSVDAGSGNVNVSGLHRQGSVYVNDAYGTSPVTLRLDVEGGAGDIALETVPAS